MKLSMHRCLLYLIISSFHHTLQGSIINHRHPFLRKKESEVQNQRT